MCNGHFFSFAGAKLRISEHIAKKKRIFFFYVGRKGDSLRMNSRLMSFSSKS